MKLEFRCSSTSPSRLCARSTTSSEYGLPFISAVIRAITARLKIAIASISVSSGVPFSAYRRDASRASP